MPETPNLLLLYLTVWILLTTILWKLRGEREDSKLSISPLIVLLRIPSSFRIFDTLRHYRSLGLLFDVGIVATFILMAEFYRLTVSRILQLLFRGGPEGVAPIMPIIPGITISIETFLYLLPGLSLAIISHELSHALAARYEGIRVRSAGFLIALGILPAAFVEPDEDELTRAPTRSRLRVYAAGILANIVVFAILSGVIIALSHGGTYIAIVDVEPGSFAYKAGIRSGDVFYSITVNSTVFHSVPEFTKYLANLREKNGGTLANVTLVVIFQPLKGENITVVKPSAPPSVPDRELYERIGIYLADIPSTLVKMGFSGTTAYTVFIVLALASMINIGLAVINAAPLFITDGAQMIRDIAVAKLGEEKGGFLATLVSAITLLVLLPNIQL